MPQFEGYLVLNRYMHHLLGAEDFETLKNLLRPLPEGPDDTGQSYFFRRLATQRDLRIPLDRLEEYDRRVMNYETRLRKARRDFQGFRYFQYLALLYTEIYLDRLTENPIVFIDELNHFLNNLRHEEPELNDFPDFALDKVRRLAFFMATGSGKTLIMHVNIWQVLYYLEHGRHSEALLPGSAYARRFDNILLITPNEGLSTQHLTDLQESGFDASLFIEDRHGYDSIFGPKVKIIEIHKLVEESSRDGVSIVLEEIGQNNLIIVDEGHKGTGSEAQAWKRRQKYLSEGGFLLEYSATFAQSIAAAGKKSQRQLLQEYGQAILFDYSYAHFYGDGFGKDFTVLNLQDSRPEQAHELLVGGLLAFYHQLYLYRQNQAAYRPYNIEKPLWVLLGSSVNAIYTQDKKRHSDVAEVVAFLRRFLEERDWAVTVIERILKGNSGFQDTESGQDLFVPHIKHLRGTNAEELYERILADVFHGRGGLEIWELKQADGELGLRLSTSDENAPYFGVINIGDVPNFKKYLAEHLGIEVKEDNFRHSQFNLVDVPNSPIYLLIGAKKFIEGWSSWRVSSMGLLNVGKGAGSQIVQLFGRGVRLKGKGMSLKRSKALQGDVPPEGIHYLETLTIFGWNANYIQTFRTIIDNEGLGKEVTLPIQKMAPWPDRKLPVPQKKAGFDTSHLTWVLDSGGNEVVLDLTPRLTALATTTTKEQTRVVQTTGQVHGTISVDFSVPQFASVLDYEALYLEALEHKKMRGYTNLYITPKAVEQVVKQRCRIMLPQDECNPERLQRAASQALKTYLDRFVRLKEREAESQNLEPAYLTTDDPRVLYEYRIRVTSKDLLKQIESLIKNKLSTRDEGEPLPRLYFDRSLFNPLLTEGGKKWKQEVSIHPPALNRDEQQFIKDLREFWSVYSNTEFRDWELYVLRNLSRAGISLFNRSGFYPDFILWLYNTQSGITRVIFVEPHGLHHGGLSGNTDKFEALNALKDISSQHEFQNKRIHLEGYILTTTSVSQISDANGRSESQLEQEYPLVFQRREYIAKILRSKR